jgi:predicted NAD/FAD-dependent oxidoreductase
MPAPAPAAIAVIGAGVAGCALVAQLRQLGFAGAISLWETGRGPGGRAGTRRSRTDGDMVINHGAPLFNITGSPDPGLLQPLLDGGWIQPWTAPMAMFEGESRLNIGRPDALGMGRLFQGRGGMDHLGSGLLQLAAGEGLCSHYGTLVRFLTRSRRGCWQLRDANRQLLAEAHWLVLSSTLLAHPRCQLILGWPDVPLAQAAALLGDWQLDHVLTTLAGLRLEARSNLLLLFAGEAAQTWRALPFQLVNFDAAAQQRWGLRRLSIQPLADGRCAVVAHSSHAFAADHLDVVGSRSAIAKLLQLPVESGREDAVVQALSEAVVHCLAPWIPGIDPSQAAPQLMRWGAAFPLPPGLPVELMVCPASRVAFCGDFIAGEGFGRVEGALRSAERLAGMLAGLLPAGLP